MEDEMRAEEQKIEAGGVEHLEVELEGMDWAEGGEEDAEEALH
jgi:hypothetical protein